MSRLRPLTDDQYFVDRMRQALGLDPLYDTTAKRSRIEFASGYQLKESYRRLADPNCKRCGGAGYFDGWECDQRCACMGMPERFERGKGVDDWEREHASAT